MLCPHGGPLLLLLFLFFSLGWSSFGEARRKPDFRFPFSFLSFSLFLSSIEFLFLFILLLITESFHFVDCTSLAPSSSVSSSAFSSSSLVVSDREVLLKLGRPFGFTEHNLEQWKEFDPELIRGEGGGGGGNGEGGREGKEKEIGDGNGSGREKGKGEGDLLLNKYGNSLYKLLSATFPERRWHVPTTFFRFPSPKSSFVRLLHHLILFPFFLLLLISFLLPPPILLLAI